MAWLRRHRLFVLIAFTYAYFFQGGDPNQASRYFLTRAIVERHAPDITPDHPNTLDKGEFRGKFYSDKAPGLSLLATVPYAAFRLAEKATGVDERARGPSLVRIHGLVFVLSGLAGVAAAWFLRRSLLLLGSPERDAGILTAGYALGTLAFPFSTVLFGHQTAAALLVATFALCLERRATRRSPAAHAALLGALWATSLVVEYPTALSVAVLGVWFLSRAPSVRDAARGFAWAVAGAAPVLVVHSAFLYWAFGSPFDLPYNHVVEPIFRAHTTSGFLGIGRPRAEVLWELLLGRYRGLFFHCPLLVLSVAGFGAWLRRREHDAELVVCAAIAVLAVAMSSAYYAWDGGFSTGPRHLVPSLPFLVVPIAFWMREGRWAARSVIVAMVPSVLVMTACTAVLVQSPEGDPRYMNGVYGIVLPALARHEVALNVLDVFHVTWQADASYNLGTFVGLGAWTSLLVPAMAWLVAYRRAIVDGLRNLRGLRLSGARTA